MIKTILNFVALTFFCIFNTNFTYAENKDLEGKIVISVSSKKDVIKLKRTMCEIKFSILNSSFGTINELSIPVKAQNDRGRELKNFGVPEVTNKQRWEPVPISKGSTINNVGRATFEEECKYMGKVELATGKIRENDCNIRMMPENIKCRDLFILVNEGEDIAVKLANKMKKTGPIFLDVGFVTVNGKKTSFIDYAAEDPIRMIGKDVVITGYINRFTEWERNKVWGYRFDLRVFSGKEGQTYAQGGDPYLTVLVAPFKNKNYGPNLMNILADLRKDNFKMLSQANSGKALIELSGKANVFSNTGDLYIQTEKIKILDKG